MVYGVSRTPESVPRPLLTNNNQIAFKTNEDRYYPLWRGWTRYPLHRTVIGQAAMNENLYIKQAEVHGMSQRGGDVQSNLRLSSDPINSDRIAKGQADVIISMEPMEASATCPI